MNSRYLLVQLHVSYVFIVTNSSDRVLVVSGVTMFEILPPELKSLAVRTKVRYAPHPYVWMAPARSNTLGLGLVTEGKELPVSELPEWSEDKVKVLPMVSNFMSPPFSLTMTTATGLEKPCDWRSTLPSPPIWSGSPRSRSTPRRCISRRCTLPGWCHYIRH